MTVANYHTKLKKSLMNSLTTNIYWKVPTTNWLWNWGNHMNKKNLSWFLLVWMARFLEQCIQRDDDEFTVTVFAVQPSTTGQNFEFERKTDKLGKSEPRGKIVLLGARLPWLVDWEEPEQQTCCSGGSGGSNRGNNGGCNKEGRGSNGSWGSIQHAWATSPPTMTTNSNGDHSEMTLGSTMSAAAGV